MTTDFSKIHFNIIVPTMSRLVGGLFLPFHCATNFFLYRFHPIRMLCILQI